MLPPGVLFDSMWDILLAGRGTYVEETRWFVRDYIILSSGMLDTHGFSWVPGSIVVIQNDDQLSVSDDSSSIPVPTGTIDGGDFNKNSYSDHLPVACRIRLAKPPVQKP